MIVTAQGDDETDGGRPASKRERRCVATGEVLPDRLLIRFVRDPAGALVPDVAAKLPGRGVWVRATRGDIELALKKGAFARSLKDKVAVGPDLADRTEAALARRCLDQLGLARRAGAVGIGDSAVEGAVRARRAAYMIHASDSADNGRNRLIRLAIGLSGVEPRIAGCFSAAELGMALGRDRVIHACLLQERLALAWAAEMGRLSGFRAIVPDSWPGSWRSRRTTDAEGDDPDARAKSVEE